MLRRKPYLPRDVLLETDTFPVKRNYSEYLETWKRGMKDVFYTALKNSTARKTNDAERKLHSGPYLGVLEPGDHSLIRNLTPRGGPGKLRSFGSKI